MSTRAALSQREFDDQLHCTQQQHQKLQHLSKAKLRPATLCHCPSTTMNTGMLLITDEHASCTEHVGYPVVAYTCKSKAGICIIWHTCTSKSQSPCLNVQLLSCSHCCWPLCFACQLPPHSALTLKLCERSLDKHCTPKTLNAPALLHVLQPW